MLKKLKLYSRLTRLDKPIGIFLLGWPMLWALWIAGQGKPDWKIVAIFIVGVVVMRSAGCVINDIADRYFDKHVKRTAKRPMTTGEISVKEALGVFIFLLFIALILVLQLNKLTILLAFVALFLACLYPFTKRWTHWPQLVLGLAFAMPVPMAFSAMNNQLFFIAALIYFIAVLWALVYDTQYAMVDKEDDIKIGIKSTAIYFGKYDLFIIASIQAVIILLLILLGIRLKLNYIYFISVIFAIILFSYQYYLTRDREPNKYFRAFLNNHWVGLVVFLGIVLGGV